MPKYHHVVFVSTGNTCRSQMAETIFNGMIDDTTLCGESRGLVVLFPEPCNPKAEVVLTNHSLSIEGRTSKQLSVEDITEDTLVLTMTLAQKIKAVHEYGHLEQIYSLKEYIGEEGDVMDPYGENLLAYEDCYVELSRLIKKAVIKISEEETES